MEQHPVPQDITGFKFKLVGDMTLKQFGELAGGAVLAYLFYATGWPGFIKFPFVFFFGFLGFALAFLPIEERPLDIWITNFIKAIYRPTIYVWEKSPLVMAYAPPPIISSQPIIPITTSRVSATPMPTPTPTPPPAPTPPAGPASPSLGGPASPSLGGPLSIEDLQKIRDDKLNEPNKKREELKKIVREAELEALRINAKPPVTTVDSLAKLRDENKLAGEAHLRELVNQHNDLKSRIETLKTKIQALQGSDTTQLQNQLKDLSDQSLALETEINNLQAPHNGVRVIEKPIDRTQTISLTDIPNIVNGLVVNENNIPLENTILIIKDKNGNSIRALKSNQIGQFIASTPLENGTYYLEFERQGYTFDTLEINLNGQVIQPLQIKAKNDGHL